jgi:hypothetical protein
MPSIILRLCWGGPPHTSPAHVIFEQVVPALEVRLVVVGGKDFGSAHHGVVGDGREAAVGDRVVADLVRVDRGADREDGLLGAPVPGLGAGAATVLLPVVDLGRFGDGEADPAGGPGRLQGCAGGLFGGDLGLDPGLRAGQPGLDRLDRGEPGLDLACCGDFGQRI